MKNILINLLKEYVNLFIDEYNSYLSKDQIELLNDINFDKILKLDRINYPIGLINFNQIILDNRIIINNKYDDDNIKSYKNYIKSYNKGIDILKFYKDHLIYLLFKLVINNNSALINGFINIEVNNLKNKYNINACNLYNREEVIASSLIKVFKDDYKKIMFMDIPTAYNFIKDNYGFRYAEFYYNIYSLMNNEFIKLDNEFKNVDSYISTYDDILYNDVYKYLFEFNLENNTK